MKKLIIAFSIISSFLVPTAFAQDEKTEGQVTFVENPAILKGNLFYGLVNLRWTVNSWFAGNTIDEAVVKSDLINQKAAEYSKIRLIAKKSQLISGTASEYQSSVYEFDHALRRIEKEEVAENPEEFVTVLSTAVLHIRFTDDVLGNTASSSEQANFLEIQNTLVSATLRTVLSLDALPALRAVMVPAEEASVLSQLRTAEVANILASTATEPSLKVEFESIRSELLTRVAPRLAEIDLEFLAGTDEVRAQSLAALSLE